MKENKFEQQLKNRLEEARLDIPFYFFEETTSTNDLAKEWVKSQPTHGTLFLARKQHAGRGTYGRTFFSERGGIYCSLLIHIKDWHFKSDHVGTLFTAVAVREAVYHVLGMKLELKWVNDLFWKGKKVGGILTEKAFNTDWLVVGIGLNVEDRLADFPDELKEVVSTLETDDPNDEIKVSLVVAIVKYMLEKGKLSCEHEMMRRYKEGLFILKQQVEIVYGDELFQVQVLDVDPWGRLAVQKSCGEILYLQAGEVKLIV